MKKIISLSAALLLCTSFAVGCGKDKSSSSEAEKAKNKYEGKWQCSEIVIGDESYDNLLGADAAIIYQIELSADNKGTYKTFLSLDSDKALDIEWKETEDNKIELTGEEMDEPVELEYKDDKMVLNMSDEDDKQQSLAYLVKVDEFKAVTEDDAMSFEYSGDASADFEINE